ncbi:electron transfer flavoprotein subunit beta/FixA family protein [Bacillus sp. 1NLA3E]|jgi:electron transfer flavoprotein beta subunit|uniref:electron transfer flavoprotein subunit beta/FixA family protein n=1 Tax=Bacillus sp. 1NLA3E TaxID=666686 RepID=UPI000247E6CD|nr:electron transfer flavoprotein subunit beta/FixA family protein [Bacillus sp. 1NLA3E]AGK53268.1 electron transfer flavoprotein alpha/beta-subunit [Bacillus sp. 1NLA3E]
MELLVCMKQVPDTEEIKVDVATGKIKDGAPNIVNPYDKNALEAAVQLKEVHGGSITVISMGSDKAKTALKECISVGADKAVLISDAAFEGSDSYSTSSILAAAINKLGQFDLIICGNQATDTNAGQVGSQIAEQLGISALTFVAKIEAKGDAIVVNREADEGYEVVEAQLPALCTVVDTINNPRLATIKTKMAANKAKIEVLTAADLEIDLTKVGVGSPTKVSKTFAPPKREAGLKIQEATGTDSAHKLFENLAAAKLI